jgi:SAM-dependent methyltransferase
MRRNSQDFDELLDQAERAHFSGWDFGFLKDRLIESPLSWEYATIVRSHFASARRALDLDTGGGERLAERTPLPELVVATESFAPNVSLAANRLRAIGARVVQVDANVQHQDGPGRGFDDAARRLPFADESFDLTTCRHGSFCAHEVARVLRAGGHLVAQLVGSENLVELNAALHGPRTVWRSPDVSPPPTLEEAGLVLLERREAKPLAVFKDIGAIVYYLKAVPWQIPDFSVAKYKERLYRLHKSIAQAGGFRAHSHRHLIVARKPGRTT